MRALMYLTAGMAVNLVMFIYFLPDVKRVPREDQRVPMLIVNDWWIVVDAITGLCTDVSVLTKQDKWNTVIVVDKYLPVIGCKSPKCFQLTWDYVKTTMQQFAITRLLEGPSRLSGVLYAMQNGAKVIFEADCDTRLENITESFHLLEEQQYGLWYNGTSKFNPFRHWGLTDTYPQEFKYGNANSKTMTNLNQETKSDNNDFFVTDFNDLPIRQGVKVSRKTCFKRSNTNVDGGHVFDQRAPIVTGLHSFSSLSTGPALFLKEAFMLLFIPPSVDDEAGQLFRTLWMHALRSIAKMPIAYYPFPLLQQDLRNVDCAPRRSNGDSISAINDPVSECMALQTCTTADVECYFTIAQQILHCLIPFFASFSNINDLVAITEAWVSDITLLHSHDARVYNRTSENMHEIHYQFPHQFRHFTKSAQAESDNLFPSLNSLCGLTESQKRRAMSKMSNPAITDLVLIVVMNYNNVFPALEYTEYIHRQFFKYIVYCVPSFSEFRAYTESAEMTYVNYIEGIADGWEFFYRCTELVIKLRLPVKGYLQIGDDVLVSHWNLASLPREVMGFNNQRRKMHLYKIQKAFDWSHWNEDYGQRATVDVFLELKNAAASPSETNPEFANFSKTFLTNIAEIIGPDQVLHGNTDIFYVPDRLRKEFIQAADLFLRHRCIAEIALPVIHVGLTKPDQIMYIPGITIWGDDRLVPWRYFRDDQSAFLHPFKWLTFSQNEEGRSFLCNTYLPMLEERQ